MASDEVNMSQLLIPDIEKKSINPAIIFIHDSNCGIFQPPFLVLLSVVCLCFHTVNKTLRIARTYWNSLVAYAMLSLVSLLG